MSAPIIPLRGGYADFQGSLPSAFVFPRSAFDPNGQTEPLIGISTYGAPGPTGPQTSNVASGITPNPMMVATQQVKMGPLAQPAFVDLAMMAIGILFLAFVAHMEAR